MTQNLYGTGLSELPLLSSSIPISWERQYENDIFVASSNGPFIYHFDLTEDRKGLLLGGPLKDKVANNADELQANIFARDFGGITDMEVGPDGFLYVLSISKGKIWRVVPLDTK